jgi:hypothetical protein
MGKICKKIKADLHNIRKEISKTFPTQRESREIPGKTGRKMERRFSPSAGI